MLVAAVLTVLFVLVALAVDVARMRIYRDQLRQLTESAALSAGTDLKLYHTQAVATASALAMRPQNPLMGRDLGTMAAADVEPGRWDAGARSFVQTAWGSASAVRVRASHLATWILGRVMGRSTQLVTATSVVAIGSQRSSRCLRPIAVPYASLLMRVGQSAANLTYRLTAEDVRTLLDPATTVTFSLSQGSGADVPGAFGWLELPPSSSNKNQQMANQLRLQCVADQVSVGQIITSFTGNMNADVIMDALRALCPTVPTSTSMARTCAPVPTIFVPIFDQVVGTGTSAQYRMRYVGALELRWIDFSGSNSRLGGNLTTLAAPEFGGFSTEPGPVRMAGLVD